MAKISVIVPVYNVEKYIKECIDSIVNQTLSDIEIILVDDGSPDGCPAICDAYAETDERIKVIHKENGGLADAKNAGMNVATGDYLLFVDSDDWLELNTCELLYSQVEEHAADFVLSAYYKELSRRQEIKRPFPDSKIVFDERGAREHLFKGVLGLTGDRLKHPEQVDALTSMCGKIYRAAIIKENNLRCIDRRIISSEVLLFNFIFSYYVKSAVYIDTPLYHYRRTNVSSETAMYRQNLFSLWKYWIKETGGFIKSKRLGGELGEVFTSRICFSVISIGGNACRQPDFKRAMREITEVLNDPVYVDAFKKFNFGPLPLHWKVFFISAKYRMRYVFFAITKIMRYLMNRKRNIK